MADPTAYAYLLGIYLGDGCITFKPPASWTLRISCDREYPGIENEICTSMRAVFPDAVPGLRRLLDCCADIVYVNHPAMGRAFPQHGPNRKHERHIALEPWQRRITEYAPGSLIRGLIHSDGCRSINRFHTELPSGRIAEYEYVRYFFSNVSEDIRMIFKAHCELLGVRVTQSNSRNLSISHRTSVAILDRHVGPKC